MFSQHRYTVLALGVMIMMTVSGCFLFGGKDETTESAIAASKALREGQLAAEDALFRADMAIEEERFDTAIIEYSRAIRADSSKVDPYLSLTRLHQQLAAQYRSEGNIEAALQENTRALKVLSDLLDYQLQPIKSPAVVPGVPVQPMDSSGMVRPSAEAPNNEPPPAPAEDSSAPEPENPPNGDLP